MLAVQLADVEQAHSVCLPNNQAYLYFDKALLDGSSSMSSDIVFNERAIRLMEVHVYPGRLVELAGQAGVVQFSPVYQARICSAFWLVGDPDPGDAAWCSTLR